METLNQIFAQIQKMNTAVWKSGNSSPWRVRMIKWAPRSIGILILIFLAFIGVDYPAAISSLRYVKLEPFFAGCAVFALAITGRYFTWMLSASYFRIGYRHSMSYVRVFLVGVFAGLGMPQGAASLTRLAVIAKDKRSVPRGIVAVAVERIMQAAVAVLLLIVSSIYLMAFNLDVTKFLLAGAALLLLGLIIYGLFMGLRIAVDLNRHLARFKKFEALIVELKRAGLEARKMPPLTLLNLLLAALATALLTIVAIYAVSRSLELQIPFVLMVAAWAAVSLTSLLPISFNGLGPREGILTAAVAGAGLNSEGGIALGLLWFLMQTASRAIAGLVYFAWLHDKIEPIADEISNA